MKEIKYNSGTMVEGLLTWLSGSIQEIVFQKNGRIRMKAVSPKRIRNRITPK